MSNSKKRVVRLVLALSKRKRKIIIFARYNRLPGLPWKYHYIISAKLNEAQCKKNLKTLVNTIDLSNIVKTMSDCCKLTDTEKDCLLKNVDSIKEKLNSMSAKDLRKKYYIEHSYILEVAASRFEKLLNTHQKILDC